MKNVGPLAALLVIAASVWWLTYYYRSQPAPGATIEHRQAVACSDCGKAYDGMLGDPPGVCHYCRKTSLYPALKCVPCGTIFAAVRPKDAAATARFACPKCGKSQIGEVPPNEVQKP
jgi:DNA-directed RNA polymerase subunit RPC12/RpoP